MYLYLRKVPDGHPPHPPPRTLRPRILRHLRNPRHIRLCRCRRMLRRRPCILRRHSRRRLRIRRTRRIRRRGRSRRRGGRAESVRAPRARRLEVARRARDGARETAHYERAARHESPCFVIRDEPSQVHRRDETRVDVSGRKPQRRQRERTRGAVRSHVRVVAQKRLRERRPRNRKRKPRGFVYRDATPRRDAHLRVLHTRVERTPEGRRHEPLEIGFPAPELVTRRGVVLRLWPRGSVKHARADFGDVRRRRGSHRPRGSRGHHHRRDSLRDRSRGGRVG